MMRSSTKVAVAAVALTPLFSAAPARAAGFGADGQFILSADRLFGLSFASVKSEAPNMAGTVTTTTTNSRTDITLFWPVAPETVYEIPHLSFDYVVASGFTVGGSLAFFSQSGKTKTEVSNSGTSTEVDSPSVTAFAIVPRVGYVLALTPSIAFWPRAGITYYSIKSETTGAGMNPVTRTTTSSGIGLDLEPMFVFSPVSNFGIFGGPVADLPLSGKSTTDVSTGAAPPDTDVKFTNLGLTFGLLGYF